MTTAGLSGVVAAWTPGYMSGKVAEHGAAVPCDPMEPTLRFAALVEARGEWSRSTRPRR